MKVIDISKRVSPSMPVYPGDHPVEFEVRATWQEQGYYLTRFHMSTHAGTHVDAPRHFIEGACGITDIGIERFIGPAVLCDISQIGPGEPITVQKLAAMEQAFQQGTRVIVHTGWPDQCPPERPEHFSDHPWFTPETCAWIASRRIGLLGMDLPSPSARDHQAVHGPLLEAGIILLEGLVNLSQLPREFNLSAIPLALAGLDGSPVRAVAWTD